ncbi:CRM-domain containing factor CFM9, mitochondrial [Euphorbia lathyris]|uniref:CRM-domain containing factor CFM9, mitochondrial n=1 Tax=Euphorbia lathyris TaxID=212925 RepID=UPI0033139601
MFAVRNCLKTLSSHLLSKPCRNSILGKDVCSKLSCIDLLQRNVDCEDGSPSFLLLNHPFNGGFSRAMSTSKGRSMRSKVERRMQKESGKTLREIRRAKKLKKKLMTEEERLIYNLKRAKKKVALLLQKLKKYELPELPAPLHDPELLTPEQSQAYKKIGFRNKNYVPVGVRGVFGGVVQNMHMHWKFHETVQVCCDNFPKEKIKEMATMLARLSGGIVINIHNVKTVIMFRGRNYRQPKNLIPLNTLTKRKALFKARFEQALESQKLNIKKFEQQLRRMGVNPEDPVAMASIQRVASTFFNAIDKKEGTPYVYQWDKQPVLEPDCNLEHPEPNDDSDQEELDRFIAEIEEAADKDWAEEEAAEQEEFGKIRYWNKEDFGGRVRRSEMYRNDVSDGENRGTRRRRDVHEKERSNARYYKSDVSEGGDQWDSDDVGNNLESDADEVHSRGIHRKHDQFGKDYNRVVLRRNAVTKFGREVDENDSGLDVDKAMWESNSEEEHVSRSSRPGRNQHSHSKVDKSEDMLSDLDNTMWELNSEEEPDLRESSAEVRSSGNKENNMRGSIPREDSEWDPEDRMWELESEEDLGVDSKGEKEVYYQKHKANEKHKTSKELDENWDSD